MFYLLKSLVFEQMLYICLWVSMPCFHFLKSQTLGWPAEAKIKLKPFKRCQFGMFRHTNSPNQAFLVILVHSDLYICDDRLENYSDYFCFFVLRNKLQQRWHIFIYLSHTSYSVLPNHPLSHAYKLEWHPVLNLICGLLSSYNSFKCSGKS